MERSLPTQTDEIIINGGTSGKADPNDRIRYKVTIQNTGGANGTGAQFTAVPDPRTTFVAGSFRSSPLAVPNAYACTGNVGFLPAVGGGTITLTGATTITNPGGVGIEIQSSTTAVTVAGATVNKGAGTGVNLGGASTGNSGTVTFAALAITLSDGTGLLGAENTGTITSPVPSGQAASARRTGQPSTSRRPPVSPNFSSGLSSTSSTNTRVRLINVRGTVIGNGGSLTGATGVGFFVSGGTAGITYNGSIGGATSYAVDIDNHDSGNITSTTLGIRVQNCGGGTVLFDNPSKSLTTGAAAVTGFASWACSYSRFITATWPGTATITWCGPRCWAGCCFAAGWSCSWWQGWRNQR